MEGKHRGAVHSEHTDCTGRSSHRASDCGRVHAQADAVRTSCRQQTRARSISGCQNAMHGGHAWSGLSPLPESDVNRICIVSLLPGQNVERTASTPRDNCRATRGPSGKQSPHYSPSSEATDASTHLRQLDADHSKIRQRQPESRLWESPLIVRMTYFAYSLADFVFSC